MNPPDKNGKLTRRTPLAIKTLALVVTVGVSLWIGRDYLESREMASVFRKQIHSRLEAQIQAARIRFDRFAKANVRLAKLLVGQQRFWAHLHEPGWDTEHIGEVERHRRPPSWYPPNSVVRAFPIARFAMLFDAKNRLREVYASHATEPPPELIRPGLLLRRLSKNQGYTTLVGQVPYLISTMAAVDAEGKLRATLMLATPIDDEFLTSSQGIFATEYPLVLLSASPSIVRASTDPQLLPTGTKTESLQHDYLVTGEAFFDYGDSDLVLRIAMVVPRLELRSLEEEVVLFNRKTNAATAGLFVLALTLITLWIIYRIRRLSDRVIEHARTALGVHRATTVPAGDELMTLAERFQMLTDEVVLAQDAMRLKHEMERHVKQLDVLTKVTGELGVGVILHGNDTEPHWMNPQMEAFIEECKRDDFFLDPAQESGNIELKDTLGRHRVFRFSRLSLFSPMDVLLLQDVTELEAKRKVLEHQALHDVLTGLPNRILFYDRLEQAIQRAVREGGSFSLLMIDMNGFKEVNDTLGHAVGDEVLRRVATRLPTCVRATDTVGRMGGDEFAVTLPEADLEHAIAVAQKVLKVFDEPFVPSEHVSIQLGASIGVVEYPIHGTDVETLLRHGDIAMYTAKRQNLGYKIYSPALAGNEQAS